MRQYRCPICGNLYPAGDPHWRTVHPEFWQWRKRFFITFLLLGLVSALLLIALDYFVVQIPNTSLRVLAPTLIYVVVVLLGLAIIARKQRQFKQKWNEEHPPSA